MSNLTRLIQATTPDGSVMPVVVVVDQKRGANADALLGVGIQNIRLSFHDALSREQKQRFGELVEYWGSLKYVTTTPVEVMWDVRDQIADVDVNTRTAHTSDITKHNILEQLLEWMLNGTPMRKTGPTAGTRAIQKLEASVGMMVVS